MNDYFKAVKNSIAVLYILPLPPEINLTVNLGGISEYNLALKKNQPVVACTFHNSAIEILKVNHVDLLIDKFDLKGQKSWFEIRDFNISNKFREIK